LMCSHYPSLYLSQDCAARVFYLDAQAAARLKRHRARVERRMGRWLWALALLLALVAAALGVAVAMATRGWNTWLRLPA
jgi:type IV secretory pathway component VirB8